jgi:hypothetical protein
VIDGHQRAPNRAGDVLREMLTCFEANRPIAAPMHHDRWHLDAA